MSRVTVGELIKNVNWVPIKLEKRSTATLSSIPTAGNEPPVELFGADQTRPDQKWPYFTHVAESSSVPGGRSGTRVKLGPVLEALTFRRCAEA